MHLGHDEGQQRGPEVHQRDGEALDVRGEELAEHHVGQGADAQGDDQLVTDDRGDEDAAVAPHVDGQPQLQQVEEPGDGERDARQEGRRQEQGLPAYPVDEGRRGEARGQLQHAQDDDGDGGRDLGLALLDDLLRVGLDGGDAAELQHGLQAQADEDGAPVPPRVEEVPDAAPVAQLPDHRLLHLVEVLVQLLPGRVAPQPHEAALGLGPALAADEVVRRLGHPAEGEEEGGRYEDAAVAQPLVGDERPDGVGVELAHGHHQLDEGAEGAADVLVGDLADVHRADDVDDALAQAADEARGVEPVGRAGEYYEEPADGEGHAGEEEAGLAPDRVDHEGREDVARDRAQQVEGGDPGGVVRGDRQVGLGRLEHGQGRRGPADVRPGYRHGHRGWNF